MIKDEIKLNRDRLMSNWIGGQTTEVIILLLFLIVDILMDKLGD